jgi:hypothetical protein
MQDGSRIQILAGEPLQQTRRGRAAAEKRHGDVQVQTFETKEQSGVFDQRALATQPIIVANCEGENAVRGSGGCGVNRLAAKGQDIVAPGAEKENLGGIVSERFGIPKPGDRFDPAEGFLGNRPSLRILFSHEISEDALVLNHKAATGSGAFPLENTRLQQRLAQVEKAASAPRSWQVAIHEQLAEARFGLNDAAHGVG